MIISDSKNLIIHINQFFRFIFVIEIIKVNYVKPIWKIL